MKNLLKAAVFSTALLTAGTALAADWTVNRVSQPALFSTDGKTWNTVTRGSDVPNAAWINTGPGGRVQLRRGRDSMIINGKSLVAAVERGRDARPETTLHHRYGAITVDVQKRDYDQMTVKTPFMAAVVKGTKFTVNGDKKGSTLRVARGLVEVANVKSGHKAYVGAGGAAEIGSTDNSVELSGSNTSMLTSSVNPGNGNANANANANAGPGNNNAGGNANANAGPGNNAGGNANAGPGNNNAGGNSNGNARNN